MLLEHFFIILFLILQPAFGQSVVWDEASKTWVSQATATPTPTPAPAPAPTPTPGQQQATPITTPTTVIQTVPTAAPAATVDLTTLATILTPIVAAISAFFVKNRKDMDKKDEEVENKSKQFVEQVMARVYPLLQQNSIIASQTAKQDVKIKEISDLVFKIMGEEANKIQGMPEIKQENMLKDMVMSELSAQQYQQHLDSAPVDKIKQQATAAQQPSMIWDDVKKEWVSK